MAMNIESEKIMLRAVETEDIDILYQWENDSDYWHLSGTMAPFSRNVLERYIENAYADIYIVRQLRMMIILKSNQNAIGTVDLFDFEPDQARVGIGILIAKEQDRKHGYAEETVRMMIKYCFQTLNLKQIWCNILENNHTSLNLFEKCGFERIGLKKEWIRIGNKWENEYMLQLINKERC